ncbi:hypothetical protein RJ639_013550 [Escallonia herrerae]|uniref:Transcription factor TFIIB cyclin-like domain-containing protein n=1 Tax=Escallonia herrerae TaxID=1293975 RepID=A0AA88VI41_9ASTE|nr:hypothetical protein RJ639_013550 [Escallonia herrerae]
MKKKGSPRLDDGGLVGSIVRDKVARNSGVADWRSSRPSVSASQGWQRSPISIAAAVIYIVTQLSDDKKPLKDVAIATGVAEGTIRNSYKDLYPHLSKIIPGWYAQEEDLKNLCSP